MAKGRKPPPAKDAANDAEVFDKETKRTQMRVAKTHDKLSKALDDPEMRKQMVEAIRRMMSKDS